MYVRNKTILMWTPAHPISLPLTLLAFSDYPTSSHTSLYILTFLTHSPLPPPQGFLHLSHPFPLPLPQGFPQTSRSAPQRGTEAVPEWGTLVDDDNVSTNWFSDIRGSERYIQYPFPVYFFLQIKLDFVFACFDIWDYKSPLKSWC